MVVFDTLCRWWLCLTLCVGGGCVWHFVQVILIFVQVMRNRAPQLPPMVSTQTVKPPAQTWKPILLMRPGSDKSWPLPIFVLVCVRVHVIGCELLVAALIVGRLEATNFGFVHGKHLQLTLLYALQCSGFFMWCINLQWAASQWLIQYPLEVFLILSWTWNHVVNNYCHWCLKKQLPIICEPVRVWFFAWVASYQMTGRLILAVFLFSVIVTFTV